MEEEFVFVHMHSAIHILSKVFIFTFCLEKIATIMLSGRLKQSNSRILNLFPSLNCENIEIKNNDFDILLSYKEQVKKIIYKSKEILINALNFGDK